MTERGSSRLWTLALITGGLVLPAWFGLGGHPERSVRTVPWLTHGGRISRAAPPGQRFLCESPGLERIDVARVRILPPGVEIELVLREEGPAGRVIRRATVLPDPADRGPRFVPFAFEAIPESGGRWYHFQLVRANGAEPAHHSAWIRFHGRVGHNGAWGNQVLTKQVVEGFFASPLDNLRALAVACEDVWAVDDEIRLELWETCREAEPLRSAALPLPTQIRSGYAFFSFAPVSGSAERTYGFRITSPEIVRFNGRGDAPTLKTYHGVPGARPGMGGMTEGAHPLPDPDLVFRAWSSYGRSRGWKTAGERAAWRLWAGALCWTASVLALVRLFFSRRST